MFLFPFFFFLLSRVSSVQQPSRFKSIAMSSDGGLQVAITSSATYSYTVNGGWVLSTASGLQNQLQITMNTDASKYTISGNDGYIYYTGSTYSTNSWTNQGTSLLSSADVIKYSSMDRDPTNVDQIMAESETTSVFVSEANAAFVEKTVGKICSATAIGTSYQLAWSSDITTIYKSSNYFVSYDTSLSVPSGWSTASLTSFSGNLNMTRLLVTSTLGTQIYDGTSWTSVNTESSQFGGMSTDGKYMVTLKGPVVQMSFNYGTNWNSAFTTNLSITPTAVAISEDGSKISMVSGLSIYQGTGCSNTGCTSLSKISISVNPVSYVVEIKKDL